MKSFRPLICAFALLSLVACDNKPMNYLSFQESEDDYWGLIDCNGNVLFADEFENEIEGVSDGVLMTTDDDGLYQYYTVAKSPKFLCGGYKSAGDFYKGIAPVVVKDEWIKFIDKKGKTVFELKEIEGKQVESVTSFHFGIAIYCLEDDSHGLIDTKGNILTKPRNVNIHFCTTDKFYYGYSEVIENEMLVVTYDNEMVLYHYKDFINDKQDKAYCELDFYNHDVRFYKNSDYYCVSTDKRHMIMDKDKVILTTPRNSKVDAIYNIMGRHILFSNEDQDRMGVMDLKGNTIIRSKYRFLAFMDERSLICTTNDEDFKMIDIKDNVINSDVDYNPEVYSMEPLFDDGIACLPNDDDEFYFVDKKGESVNNETYYSVCELFDNNVVKSDFLNIKKFISELDITEFGVGGVTINNTVGEFVEFDNMDSDSEIDATDYTYEDEMEFSRYIDGIEVLYFPHFSEYIALNAVSEYGGESVWSEGCELTRLTTGFYLRGKYQGKGDVIFNGLYDFFFEKCEKFIKDDRDASFRFSNKKDLRLIYNKEKNFIALHYFNEVNE